MSRLIFVFAVLAILPGMAEHVSGSGFSHAERWYSLAAALFLASIATNAVWEKRQ